MLIDTNNVAKTVAEMQAYSSRLGYELSEDDCLDVINTGYHGEPLKSAVRDWLNAYETCKDLGGDDDN